MKYSAWVDGKRVYGAWASKYNATVNRRYHLSGRHGFDIRVAVGPGMRHTLCMVFANVGAGYPSARRCVAVQAPKAWMQVETPRRPGG